VSVIARHPSASPPTRDISTWRRSLAGWVRVAASDKNEISLVIY